MPSHKSAEKRVRQSEKRRQRNMAVKSSLRTARRKALEAIASGDASAEQLSREAVSKFDKAAAGNVVHRNAASRLQARLAKATKRAAAAGGD